MKTRWDFLYRGPLSSCNYACGYCPFAKTRNTIEELRDDAKRLNRFVDWVAAQPEEIGILFTPWGEALIHRSYQEALTRLSHLPNVYRVAIQTNLSCNLDWMENCHKETFALWTTWHPTQTSREKFATKSRQLSERHIRHSVGVVGVKEELSEIQKLRAEITPETYLWINAYKRDPDYYTESDILAFEAIDPHFRTNTKRHPSLGKSCRAGHQSFTIDGEGDARRCHFIEQPIANIYKDDLRTRLTPQACSNATCGCHIGYVHMNDLRQDELYQDGLLERIPANW